MKSVGQNTPVKNSEQKITNTSFYEKLSTKTSFGGRAMTWYQATKEGSPIEKFHAWMIALGTAFEEGGAEAGFKMLFNIDKMHDSVIESFAQKFPKQAMPMDPGLNGSVQWDNKRQGIEKGINWNQSVSSDTPELEAIPSVTATDRSIASAKDMLRTMLSGHKYNEAENAQGMVKANLGILKEIDEKASPEQKEAIKTAVSEFKEGAKQKYGQDNAVLNLVKEYFPES